METNKPDCASQDLEQRQKKWRQHLAESSAQPESNSTNLCSLI